MDNHPVSCTVAPLTKCNHATSTHVNATHNETTVQPPSLLSLALKVLERNKRNSTRNLSAIAQLQHTETNATKVLEALPTNTKLQRETTPLGLTTIGENQDSCTVAFPIERNHETHFKCHQCGYRSLFCSCKLAPAPGIAICSDCEHFTVDTIGDGTGIGSCELGVKWTQEFNGRMPLFRYSERHCIKFSKIN